MRLFAWHRQIPPILATGNNNHQPHRESTTHHAIRPESLLGPRPTTTVIAMLCTAVTATAPLRTAALGTLRIQPTAMMTGSSGYSTTTRERVCPARRGVTIAGGKNQVAIRPLSSLSSGARTVLFRTQQQQHQQQRQSSTTVTSSSQSSLPPNTPSEQPLTWNSFLHLRRRRRYYNIGGSILTSLSSTLLGVSYLSQQDIDAIGSQLYGLDPFMVLGLATVGFGVAGWLAGPVLGGLAFKVANRGVGGRVMAEVTAFRFHICFPF
jgi:Mitochondrial import protein Pam17